MRRICDVTKKPFDAAAMIDIYDNSDTYRDLVMSDTADYGYQQPILKLLQKMSLARQFQRYKRQNHLLDFHDLLLLTYDALTSDADRQMYKRYAWVQVDEVQDLNPLQMAIVKQLTARPFHTVMFLGDEQQAIFSVYWSQARRAFHTKATAGVQAASPVGKPSFAQISA